MTRRYFTLFHSSAFLLRHFPNATCFFSFLFLVYVLGLTQSRLCRCQGYDIGVFFLHSGLLVKGMVMQLKLHYRSQSQREIFATSERYDYGIRRQAVTQLHIPSGALLMAKHGKLAPLNDSAFAMERFLNIPRIRRSCGT